MEEHREKGANLAVDVTFKYLQFFCDDDALLKEVETEYSAGRMTTGAGVCCLYSSVILLCFIVLKHMHVFASGLVLQLNGRGLQLYQVSSVAGCHCRVFDIKVCAMWVEKVVGLLSKAKGVALGMA